MIDMSVFFTMILGGFVVLILLLLIRVFKGPSVFDRLNGLGLIGVVVIVALILIGVLDGREEMFLDIGMTFAILGFVGSVVIAKYLFEEIKRR